MTNDTPNATTEETTDAVKQYKPLSENDKLLYTVLQTMVDAANDSNTPEKDKKELKKRATFVQGMIEDNWLASQPSDRVAQAVLAAISQSGLSESTKNIFSHVKAPDAEVSKEKLGQLTGQLKIMHSEVEQEKPKSKAAKLAQSMQKKFSKATAKVRTSVRLPSSPFKKTEQGNSR